ncbi:zinc finger protein [Trifolium repens]|nr:zinc finger protein [Trifolium repens]
MCNIDRDPNKGKEKVNEEPIVNFKTMEIQKNENKRKAIVLAESDVHAKNSKSPNNGNAGEKESTNSSKDTSPFILFGFIIDPKNRMKHAYSCNFCSRKFINPQALGGHQNSHKLERRLKKRIDNMKIDWINYSNGNQGVASQNTIIPYHGGYGYQYEVINEAHRCIVSQQTTMPKIDYGSVSNLNASDAVDHDEKETQEEEESNIDLTLKL